MRPTLAGFKIAETGTAAAGGGDSKFDRSHLVGNKGRTTVAVSGWLPREPLTVASGWLLRDLARCCPTLRGGRQNRGTGMAGSPWYTVNDWLVVVSNDYKCH